MKIFLKKFQFKWWSWEIDTVKLFPFIILVLAFLPILPYEKKDGNLISVTGISANTNNFYDLGLKALKTGDIKEGDALYELFKMSDIYKYDFDKYRKYLIEKGYSSDEATCLVTKDAIFSDFFIEKEMYNIVSKYLPSPVPMIWIARLIILNQFQYYDTSQDDFHERFYKNCKKFSGVFPPSDFGFYSDFY